VQIGSFLDNVENSQGITIARKQFIIITITVHANGHRIWQKFVWLHTCISRKLSTY